MTIKKDPSNIEERLTCIMSTLEEIVADYIEEYADYGWDSFADTLAAASAQIYMQRIVLQNATIKKDMYR